MRTLLTSITLVAMVPIFSFAGKHTVVWQNGTLVAEHRQNTFAGIGGTATTNRIGTTKITNENAGASYDVFEIYVIRGNDGIRYTARQFLRSRWSHRANLIVNDQVEYRVAGRKLFVKGTDGKSYKCQLMERVRLEKLGVSDQP